MQGMDVTATPAEVDIEKSPALMERFGFTAIPSIVFFRHGQMYTYDGSYEKGSIIKSATDAAKLVGGVIVPKEKMLSDNIVGKIMK